MFPLLVTVNPAAVNIHGQLSYEYGYFSWKYLGLEWLGPLVTVFNLLKATGLVSPLFMSQMR